MITQHQQITLLEKPVLQHVIFKPPLQAKYEMKAESCFIYALNGKATVVGNDERQDFEAGEGVLMKCGRYLNRWHANVDDRLNEAIVMHLYPDVLRYIYDNEVPAFVKQKDKVSVSNIQIIRYQEALQNYIIGLRFYFNNPSLMDDNLIKIKLKELILLLYHSKNEAIRTLLQELFEEEKSSFRQIIQHHLYDTLSLEDLAFLTHTSLSTFKRRFKETFNASPSRYIKAKRLEKAAELLTYTDKRITDICYDCGFNDAKVFTKNFSAHFNISPSAYRKQHTDPN